MKLKLIILWIKIKGFIGNIKITWAIIKWWIYIHSLRFAWNWVICPIYFRYESKVIGLIEGLKVNSEDFTTPTRLTYYQGFPVVQIEDRYDYSHDGDYQV